jgi:hypothetical protein
MDILRGVPEIRLLYVYIYRCKSKARLTGERTRIHHLEYDSENWGKYSKVGIKRFEMYLRAFNHLAQSWTSQRMPVDLKYHLQRIHQKMTK